MALNKSIGYGTSSRESHLMFNGDERQYEQWETRFLGYLKIKKLKDVVAPLPGQAAVDDPSLNEQVYAELCQFLDSTSMQLIMRDAKDNGKEALKILREHYAGSSKPRIITMWRQLSRLTKGSNETVTEYVLKAEQLAAALKAANENVSDSLLIAMVLDGLPREFMAFVTVITQTETVLSFQKFKQQLRSFEETMSAQSTRNKTGDDNIMSVNSEHGVTCFKCGQEGHKANKCPKGKNSGRGGKKGGNGQTGNTKYCTHCKTNTHNTSNCRKLQKMAEKDSANSAKTEDGEKHIFFKLDDTVVDIPSDDPSDEDFDMPLLDDNVSSDSVDCDDTATVIDVMNNILLSVDETHTEERESDNEDIIVLDGVDDSVKNNEQYSISNENGDISDPHLVDTGATAHINNDETNFVDFDPNFKPEKHTVELADGSRQSGMAEKKGSVAVAFRNVQGEVISGTLRNVLYMPTYPQNIFSVSAATEEGCVVIFRKGGGSLISKGGMEFPISSRGKLYFLNKISQADVRSETLLIWHKLLGHCNCNDILKLPSVVKGMQIHGKASIGQCETCTLSKLTNSINKEPSPRATAPFELIFTDLAGPIEPIGKDGFRYVMIFTDDYSGCMFTYFLKSKSDAISGMEKFLVDISPFGKVKTLNFHEDVFPSGTVEKLRSDNGGEYISKPFKDLLNRHNVKHEFTSPYSPHQNGCAERSWRTLFDMSRSMISESQLPKFLWNYAVMYATYIRNRCYVQRIQQTPFGMITGMKPDMSNIHLFGSVCYAFIEGHKKKLDDRSKKGYFVGIDKDSPSSLVFYPETNTVMKHRRVKFTDQYEMSTISETSEKVENPRDTGLFYDNLFDDDKENQPNLQQPDPEQQHQQQQNQQQPLQQQQPAAAAANEGERRYPTRERNPPEFLADYVKSLGDIYLDYCYMMKVPTTHKEAVADEHSDQWQSAMEQEIESLKDNNTFVATKLPSGTKVVGGRWVYTVKGDFNSEPVYKARYVAKGYSQTPGVDYNDTFAPTPRMESLRVLLQFAVQNALQIHQMDVKSAYLHAPLEEEIYVNPPKGFGEVDESGGKLVWKLLKSLYGLKQSGRNWHNHLRQFLFEKKFVQSDADPCIFIYKHSPDLVIMLVWVDDIVLVVNNNKAMGDIKKVLKKNFKMKDMGPLTFFLGIQFHQKENSLVMNQSHYLSEILKKFKMDNCKPRKTPCETNAHAYDSDEPFDSRTYREAVGSLVYAMTCTRPDLSYVVTKLSQNLASPTQGNWLMVCHVFRYIKGTLEYGLSFRRHNSLNLQGFSDSDWASCPEKRRSTSGYCFTLSEEGPAVSWKSRKQSTVALSTCEAEYVALSATCQESTHIARLLKSITGISFEPVTIHGDNTGSIFLAQNPVNHNRSKHIDVKFHHIRQQLERKKVCIQYIPSGDNLADPFTKPLPAAKWRNFLSMMFGRK